MRAQTETQMDALGVNATHALPLCPLNLLGVTSLASCTAQHITAFSLHSRIQLASVSTAHLIFLP